MNYLRLVAFSSSVTSPKVFCAVKFCAKFEFVLQKHFLLVVVNHSKSDFSTLNINCVKIARKFVKCIPEILSNTAAIREENSTEIDSQLSLKIIQRETNRITFHYSAELQNTTNRQTKSYNFKTLN